jgi:hypothetical protein
MRHDQAVDRFIVEDRIQQDVERIGRGLCAVQVLDGLPDDPPVFSGPGNFNSFRHESIDVLQERLQEPVVVCAIRADVIDDLHEARAALVFLRTIVAFLDSETGFG